MDAWGWRRFAETPDPRCVVAPLQGLDGSTWIVTQGVALG